MVEGVGTLSSEENGVQTPSQKMLKKLLKKIFPLVLGFFSSWSPGYCGERISFRGLAALSG